MTSQTNKELLVVYKPDGLDLSCSEEESRRVLAAWTDLLRWLRGADPDDQPESELIGHIARKTALRTPRFPEYDIRLWAEQAQSLPALPDYDDAETRTLPELASVLFASLQLRRTRQQRCWLNRVAIELLYGRAESFQRDREALIPRLLDGPSSLERWTGHRLELAMAIKFLVRRVLSTAAITNLVHVEITTAIAAADVEHTVTLSP